MPPNIKKLLRSSKYTANNAGESTEPGLTPKFNWKID